MPHIDNPLIDNPLAGNPLGANRSDQRDSNQLGRHAVTVELEATDESVTMARTVVTCLAADAGLNVIEIDDVRLALDEIIDTLVRQTDGSIRVYFTRLDDGLQVAVSVTDGADVVVPKASVMILNALVDDVSFAGNYAIFTKRKRH